MKHFFLAICALTLAAMVLAPASASAQNAYNNKDMVLSAGLGLGTFAGSFGSTDVPPIFVAFETGIPVADLKNKVTVGGILGYSGSSEEFYFGKWKYTYIFIGATGNYHFLETNKNLDAYAGIGLGYTIVSSSVTYAAGYSELTRYSYSAGASYFAYDFHVGARYYFAQKFGVMGELGWGFGIFRVGVVMKL